MNWLIGNCRLSSSKFLNLYEIKFLKCSRKFAKNLIFVSRFILLALWLSFMTYDISFFTFWNLLVTFLIWHFHRNCFFQFGMLEIWVNIQNLLGNSYNSFLKGHQIVVSLRNYRIILKFSIISAKTVSLNSKSWKMW